MTDHDRIAEDLRMLRQLVVKIDRIDEGFEPESPYLQGVTRHGRRRADGSTVNAQLKERKDQRMNDDKEHLRQKVDDLMEVALDERGKNDKERLSAAVQAFRMIRKHDLIEKPFVNKFVDADTSEAIEAGEKLLRAGKRLLDKFQGKSEDTSTSGGRRRRRQQR